MTPPDNPNGYPAHAVEMLQRLATITSDLEHVKERVDDLPCKEHSATFQAIAERVTRIEEKKADKSAMNWTTGILTTIGAAVGAIALFVSRKVGAS